MTEQTRRKPKEREVDNEQLKLEVVPSKHEFNLDGITRGHSRFASFSNDIGDELNTMMNSIIRKHMRSALANDDFDVPMRKCIFDLDHLSKMTQMHNAV